MAWAIPLGILGARTVGGDNDGTDGVVATKKAIFPRLSWNLGKSAVDQWRYPWQLLVVGSRPFR